MIRIKWRKKASTFEYDPEDMIGEPVVYWINEPFARIYDFTPTAFPDPDSPNALTVEQLPKMIEDYVEPEHMKEYMADQKEVTDVLVYRDKEGQARVPLQFNDKHRGLPNKIFLPCLMAKRTIGQTGNPHTTYMVISYIEDFWPIGHFEQPAQSAA